MRNKLITLSYIFSGDINKIEHAIKSNIDVVINKKFIKKLDDLKVNVVTILDDNYPKCLLELFNPPLVLYYQGDLSLLDMNVSAVIGSRKNLLYSEEVCVKLVESLVKSDVIISGLANGIDSIAHYHTVSNGGKTIAVIGSGFNKIYPKDNEALAKLIAKDHLLISEYPPNVNAQKHHFPLRNRLIAALAKKVYVIEAALKSGSLITANIALDLGKKIYCAPGSLLYNNYRGSHKLINDGAFLLEI